MEPMLQNKYKIMTFKEYDYNFAKANYLIITFLSYKFTEKPIIAELQ